MHKSVHLSVKSKSVSFLSVKGPPLHYQFATKCARYRWAHWKKKIKLTVLAKKKKKKTKIFLFVLLFKNTGVNYKDSFKNPCTLQTIWCTIINEHLLCCHLLMLKQKTRQRSRSLHSRSLYSSKINKRTNKQTKRDD